MNSSTAAVKNKKGNMLTWILIFVMVLGVGIMAYPTVSDWWNSFHSSKAIASYSREVDSAAEEKLAAMIKEAHEYNEKIADKNNPYLMTPADIEEYNSLLDLSGTGLIGYVQIPSLGVNIPVYHGTEESILQIAAGHLNWTSLPVGGEGTHAVLSGHRGLPSAKLFTDLDKMREGDLFTVTVLNQVMTYEVDQIRIVEPDDIKDLNAVPGKDYCTLFTCTPYGVNTHRLLIRGHRTEIGNTTTLLITPDAFLLPKYLTIPAVCIPLLFVFLVILLIITGRRRSVHSKIEYESFEMLLEKMRTGENHENK